MDKSRQMVPLQQCSRDVRHWVLHVFKVIISLQVVIFNLDCQSLQSLSLDVLLLMVNYCQGCLLFSSSEKLAGVFSRSSKLCTFITEIIRKSSRWSIFQEERAKKVRDRQNCNLICKVLTVWNVTCGNECLPPRSCRVLLVKFGNQMWVDRRGADSHCLTEHCLQTGITMLTCRQHMHASRFVYQSPCSAARLLPFLPSNVHF